MIKKAFEYLVGLGEAKKHEIHGDVYSDKPLHRIDKYIPRASEIDMNTLSSLVDYIKSNVDTMAEKMIVQVISPTQVKLFSQLDENRCREQLVEVNALIPSFNYERFIEHETFCINVQSKFIDDPTTDKALILKFAGTVESGTVAEYGDDGVTQKATVKTGIASKGDAIVPNPVKLRPFRTFIEVEQPVSDFIFRIKQDKYDGISCAIFEADGGAWKNVAMKKIKEYLEFELADYKEQFTVIS
jgi:hypothetical protein